MANTDRFWLGPLGLLRALPSVAWGDDVQAPLARIGGAQDAIDGRLSVADLGSKKQWSFTWPFLTPDEVAPIEAWWLHLADASLRLLDQRRRNRLSRDGSSAGCRSRSVAAHTTTAGTPVFVPVADYPTSSPWYGLVDGGISWPVPASTAATMRIDGADRIPLLPGEQVTLAVPVKGSGSAQVGAQLYDLAGASAGTSLASAVTLAGWTTYTRTFTPTGTQVSAELVIVAASGSARTLTVGPALWGAGGAWAPGTGCPQVELIDFAQSYADTDDEAVSLTVREV